MTRIPIHIPVTKFAVEFELGESRPYSQFEQFLLESVHGGLTTIEALSKSLAVPSRLVIEGIVTLVHAGWVGIQGDGSGLQATPPGAAAISAGQPPETLVVRRPNPIQIVMERHTGATCLNGNVTLHRTRFLDASPRDSAHRLPARVNDNSLEPSQSRRHIVVRPSQWIRWVDPDPQITSKNGHLAIGLFDTETGRLLNVPEEFRVALEPVLIERLGAPAAGAPALLAVKPESGDISLAANDMRFVVNGDEHEGVLAEALRSAHSRIAICSAFATERCIEAHADALAQAIGRGVVVDVLWGYSTEATTKSVDRLKKLAYDNRDAEGSVRFNREPTNSHAKLLLWDSADGDWHTVIGSYNWLSALGTQRGEISARISSVAVAAQMSHFIADIVNSLPSGRTDVVAKSWVRLADTLNAMTAHEASRATDVTAAFVFGRAHDSLLRRAIVDPDPVNLVVLSGAVSDDGIQRLRSGSSLNRKECRGLMSAGEILEGTSEESVVDAVNAIGSKWMASAVHAKVLVHGDSVTVGSYNYLSTDPDGRSARGRELSIRLDGTAVLKSFVERLEDLLQTQTRG